MSRAAALPPMLLGLVVLLLLQMLGLVLAELLPLPVPGTVLGLILLVILALIRPTQRITQVVEPAGAPLLRHLQLLFVPPGVGVVVEIASIAQNALPLALAVGGSFVAALVAAGHVLQWLLRRTDRGRAGGPSATGPGAS